MAQAGGVGGTSPGRAISQVGFIVTSMVTNMTLPSRSAVRFYNKRGTAGQSANRVGMHPMRVLATRIVSTVRRAYIHDLE